MTAPIIAVVGGGQLARMMAGPATEMGITLRVLVESATASAAGPAHEIIVGMPADAGVIAELLDGVAVVTWEHEHIPPGVFSAARAAGVPALPSAAALGFAQDKIAMRTRMDELGLPNPRWRAVATHDDVEDFLAECGSIAVLKTARGGYDGKGVRIIRSAADADDWISAAAGWPHLLAEELVPFSRELAVQVARRPSGETSAWPVVESTQRNGVCAEVIAPAPHLSAHVAERARSIALTIASELDVVGVLAVELFQVGDDVVINELAMRPHNSGHWTMEGAVTGQFEQHLRAVLDLPLGDTSLVAPWAVMVNALGGVRQELSAAHADIDDAGVRLHLYAKDVRPGRKVGHVTVVGDDLESILQRARSAADIVRDGGAS